MIDQNVFLSTLTTMAQALAALVAFAYLFVSQKSNEYQEKMKREMSNIAGAFAANLHGDAVHLMAIHTFGSPQLHLWQEQAERTEAHGIIVEMRDIFAAHAGRQELGERILSACKHGTENYERRGTLLAKFKVVIQWGLSLIFVDIVGILLSTPAILKEGGSEIRIASWLFLVSIVLITGWYLLHMARFIFASFVED